MKSNYKVLIYYHIPEYVDRYERLLREARKDVQLLACKNKSQINQAVDKADIIFSGHTFPVNLIPNAKNLKWIQSTSAGVENYARSKLIPTNVIITKVKGVFGPIMAEYVIAYILAITQNMKKIFDNQK